MRQIAQRFEPIGAQQREYQRMAARTRARQLGVEPLAQRTLRQQARHRVDVVALGTHEACQRHLRVLGKLRENALLGRAEAFTEQRIVGHFAEHRQTPDRTAIAQQRRDHRGADANRMGRPRRIARQIRDAHETPASHRIGGELALQLRERRLAPFADAAPRGDPVATGGFFAQPQHGVLRFEQREGRFGHLFGDFVFVVAGPECGDHLRETGGAARVALDVRGSQCTGEFIGKRVRCGLESLDVQLRASAHALALRSEHADDFLARNKRDRRVAEPGVARAPAEYHRATQHRGATRQALPEAQMFACGERIERRRSRLQQQ